MRHRPVLRPATALIWTCLACLSLTGLFGCGYQTAELYPEQYTTVAVPIFENRTSSPRVENAVTEALIKEIEQRTPYRVVPPGSAQTLLSGEVVGWDNDLLSRTRTGGVPQELEAVVTVNFRWRDLQTGEVLVSRSGFSAVGRYSPTRQLGERPEIGQAAAVQGLARDVVSTLRTDW
ncbi:MAG: LptE family protein [Planctomycetota bacterium]